MSRGPDGRKTRLLPETFGGVVWIRFKLDEKKFWVNFRRNVLNLGAC